MITVTGGWRAYRTAAGSAVTAAFPEALRPGVPVPGAEKPAVRHGREYLLDVGRIHVAFATDACQHGEGSDKDIAEWLPMDGEVCDYLTRWTVAKTRWGLSIDTTEQTAMHRISADCVDEDLTIELAR
ncbi:hypothetical protein [Kitasatospora sp. NPDC087314]|uniref:hypothetical protein n=1 Tax=Kitasatospora sp. NPDC087314 TaxID=3364068 RepID=UPI0037FBF8CC